MSQEEGARAMERAMAMASNEQERGAGSAKLWIMHKDACTEPAMQRNGNGTERNGRAPPAAQTEER